jgi:hypothetical protein
VSLAHILRDKAFRQDHRSRLGLKLALSVMKLHTTERMMNYWRNPIFFPAVIGYDNWLRQPINPTQLWNPGNRPGIYVWESSETLPECVDSLPILAWNRSPEIWYREVFDDLNTEVERKLVCIIHRHLPVDSNITWHFRSPYKQPYCSRVRKNFENRLFEASKWFFELSPGELARTE